MSFGLQDVVAVALAGGALAWLVRRRLKRGAAGPACEGCPAAGASPDEGARDFVPLGDLAPRTRRRPRSTH